MTSKQRRIDVDARSRINVDTTLLCFKVVCLLGSICIFFIIIIYKIYFTSSILLKELLALKNSETVYFTSIFSTRSYSDIALIDNFDLIFSYFYFVFENFGNNSVLTS